MQIFRLDNPLFGKGLTIPQRLCFLNAMIHFLHGLPRIIFLIAPLPFLFANIYVILRQCDRDFRVLDPAYGAFHDDDVHDSPRLPIPLHQCAV